MGLKIDVIVLLVGLLAALVASALWPKQYRYPLDYSEEVGRWAEYYSVDPYLVYAVIKTESGFEPEAESSAGARGLMQMTEETFDWLKPKIAPDEALRFSDLFTPEVSIRFGTCFLAMCLERYGGDVSTAAAAYHSGWGTVDSLLENEEYSENQQWLIEFPYRQMGHYVRKINDNYQLYLDLYVNTNGKDAPET